MLDRCVLFDTMGGLSVDYLNMIFPCLRRQEPVLFACSIRDNIKYGNPSATMDQVEAAAKLANAHDFIISFSDGYDTQVGDKGLFRTQSCSILKSNCLSGRWAAEWRTKAAVSVESSSWS
jgi:hypothetical protein